MTIGVDVQTLKIPYNQRTLSLRLWDIGGSERYMGATAQYCRNCNIVFFVYDTSRSDGATALPAWSEVLRTIAPRATTICIGTKSDLVQAVAPEDVQAMLPSANATYTINAKEDIRAVFDAAVSLHMGLTARNSAERERGD